jgi:excisionase family DNA binding protein
MKVGPLPEGKPPEAVRQDFLPSPVTGPLLLTAEQVATALSICRTKVYELIRTGQLESVQIGSSRRIPVDAVSDYVERLRASSDYTRTKHIFRTVPDRDDCDSWRQR